MRGIGGVCLNKLISIVVPVFNEEQNIFPMHKRIRNIFLNTGYSFEIIFVDNCSTDDTVRFIKCLAQENSNVCGLVMSRNFGSSQPSVMAGMEQAKGAAVILIDGDIQDPPEMIPEFLKKWEEGYDIVYGIRKRRKGSIPRRIGYKLFYRILSRVSYINIPKDAGDFGLIDRRVVEEIQKFRENEIFFRGIRAWVGFNQTGIEYTRADRERGKTSIPFLDNFKWVKMGIFNFSYKPLEYIFMSARILLAFFFGSVIFNIILYCSRSQKIDSISTVIIVLLLIGAVQLFALGIVGEYIARIFNEVKGRPRFIIKEIICKDGMRKDKK